jgi:hypothetical protein
MAEIVPENKSNMLSGVYFFFANMKTKKNFLIIRFFFFIYDYPNNPRIEAHYMSNGRLYILYYNIIAVGNYPSIPRLTQKSQNNLFQYLIPNGYIIETELSKWNLRCETKNITSSKVL